MLRDQGQAPAFAGEHTTLQIDDTRLYSFVQ